MLFINQGCCTCRAPTTKPHQRGSNSSPWSPPVRKKGVLPELFVTVQHETVWLQSRHASSHTSQQLRVTQFISFLLAASCSSAQGWEAVSARAWESGALICRCVRRKGQDLKQKRLAEKQPVGSCWSNYALRWRILFIFWSEVQESWELFFEAERMSSCLSALGSWRTVLYSSSVPSTNAQENIQ